MQRNTAEKVLLIILIAAVTFFGIAAINALDSMRKEMRELRKALEYISLNQPTLTPGTAAQIKASAEKSPLAEYYPANARRGGEMRSAISSDVGSLNPVLSNEAITSRILSFCTSSLGTRDMANPERFVPLMARSWEVSPDGKLIRISLRPGILWQSFTDPDNGRKVPSREVTADDFVFYLEVIRDPAVNAGALRSYFQDLEYIRANSRYELELRWKYDYFRSLEMSLGLSPLPRHFYCPDGKKFDPVKFNDDHKRNNMIVGCGPYQLESRIRDQRIVLRRFKGYFGEALGIAPPVEKRIFEIVKADNTRFQMLLSGELDELGLSPEQWLKRSFQKPFSNAILTAGKSDKDQPLAPGETIRRIKYLANAYFYIGYNLRNPLFTDRRVRQALTMICNRQRILQDVYFGQGQVISGPFFYDSPYYDRDLAPWPYDPAQARKLLLAAGWQDRDGDGVLDKNGKKFEFTALQVAGNPIQEKILSIFKEDLAKAGIDMKIAVFEWPIYIEKLEKRSFEVCSLGWQLPFESDPYQVWHSSQSDIPMGSNHVGFKNAQADKLIEEIRRTFDVKKRIKLCHEFQKLLHTEQPYTFLIVPQSLQALSGRFSNVECFPLGTNSECFQIQK